MSLRGKLALCVARIRELCSRNPGMEVSRKTRITRFALIRATVSAVAFLFTAPLLAAQVACPDGIHYVSLGASMQTVMQVCGKPKNVTHTGQSNAKKQQGYRVLFYGKSVPTQYSGQIHFERFEVVMHGNKVGAIRHMGSRGLSSTLLCDGVNIAIGADLNSVLNACGMPQHSRYFGTKGKKAAPPPHTVLQYQLRSYMPVKSYVFNQKDQLIEVR